MEDYLYMLAAASGCLYFLSMMALRDARTAYRAARELNARVAKHTSHMWVTEMKVLDVLHSIQAMLGKAESDR